jgi:putative endonuclease
MAYYVYILASKPNGVLYVGVTNNLVRRVHKHKTHAVAGFTQRYNVAQLVWFEQTDDVLSAIAYEKRLKGWNKVWKVALVEKTNPHWQDLYAGLLG